MRARLARNPPHPEICPRPAPCPFHLCFLPTASPGFVPARVAGLGALLAFVCARVPLTPAAARSRARAVRPLLAAAGVALRLSPAASSSRPYPCKGVVAKPAVSDRAIFAIRHDLIWQGQITIFPVLRQCSHSRVQRQLKDCSVGGHRRARPSAMGTCPAPPRRNHRHSPRSHSAVCCSCGVFTSRLAERNDCNEMMSSKSD